jgi:hypothetical protein
VLRLSLSRSEKPWPGVGGPPRAKMRLQPPKRCAFRRRRVAITRHVIFIMNFRKLTLMRYLLPRSEPASPGLQARELIHDLQRSDSPFQYFTFSASVMSLPVSLCTIWNAKPDSEPENSMISGQDQSSQHHDSSRLYKNLKPRMISLGLETSTFQVPTFQV